MSATTARATVSGTHRSLRLGTRGSPLALAQAGQITRRLQERSARPAVLVTVATAGDSSTRCPAKRGSEPGPSGGRPCCAPPGAACWPKLRQHRQANQLLDEAGHPVHLLGRPSQPLLRFSPLAVRNGPRISYIVHGCPWRADGSSAVDAHRPPPGRSPARRAGALGLVSILVSFTPVQSRSPADSGCLSRLVRHVGGRRWIVARNPRRV